MYSVRMRTGRAAALSMKCGSRYAVFRTLLWRLIHPPDASNQLRAIILRKAAGQANASAPPRAQSSTLGARSTEKRKEGPGMTITILPAQGRKLLAPVQLGLALFLAAVSTAAQAPTGPIAPKAGTQVQQAPQKPGIRVKVDLVNTPVVVTNGQGEMVLDLTQKDFRVLDNGVEQKIETLDSGEVPLSVAIVVETSSRITPLLPAIRKTGI